MYRRLFAATIIVLLLSLAFASVSFAQTGTGDQGNQQNQANQNQGQDANQGANPGSAFTNAGQGRALAQGQRHWYAFQYSGDNSPIQIRLRNAPNLMFSVWTQQQIAGANGNFGTTSNPVGRSTANEEQFGGDQYWTGSFNTPGTYYVLVERMQGGNSDNAGGNYALEITGRGVSFGGQAQGNQQGQTGTQAGAQQGQDNQQDQTGTQTGTQQGGVAPSTLPQTGGQLQTGTGDAQAQGGVSPSTLPQTGGEAASALPLLIGGMGALSVAAGALLRRKK